jgi:hypothetical protein
MCALDRVDVTFVSEGMDLIIRKNKTDQTSEGRQDGSIWPARPCQCLHGGLGHASLTTIGHYLAEAAVEIIDLVSTRVYNRPTQLDDRRIQTYVTSCRGLST